jgi:type IV secretory pathway TraG/TraD family ATPase VirD4
VGERPAQPRLVIPKLSFRHRLALPGLLQFHAVAARQQQARKLLKEEEVINLPQDVAITFTPGVPPIATKLVPYYLDRPGKAPSRLKRLLHTATIWATAVAILGLLTTLAVGLTKTVDHNRTHYRVAR